MMKLLGLKSLDTDDVGAGFGVLSVDASVAP
jgi:hypothetical protein